MTTIRNLVGTSALSILLLGCSVQHIEYQSNEFLEGPGLFTQALTGSDDNVEPDAADPSDLSRNGAGQAEYSEMTSIDDENRRLLSEFRNYLESKNLSKESQQYEEFRQWLMWRSENETVSEQ